MKVTFCALCRDADAVERIGQAAKALFPSDTEYLLIDHSRTGIDCYQALREFTIKAQGEVIIVSHDDVSFERLTFQELILEIEKALQQDPGAAVFGVAGCTEGFRDVGHFRDAKTEHRWGLPNGEKVVSLDEVLLVIMNGQGIGVSEELSGFHLYGTDLCLNAERVGKTCRVIDFPVIHHSVGKIDGVFFKAKDAFEEHLRKISEARVIKTTCSYLYGGHDPEIKVAALLRSWQLLAAHPSKDVARQCISERGRRILGILWDIRVFTIWIPETVRNLKSLFHTHRRRLKKALYGERKRAGRGGARSQ
jgi:hypothetical protein